VIIAVTNSGPPCSIDGYPRIVATAGHTLQERPASLSIDVSDGPDYEHPDPGPHRLTLLDGVAASFALGSNTAAGTDYILTAFTITMPGSSGPSLTVPVRTGGSAFTGKPVHVEVTAFVKGSRGPPIG
jgi:hypothetical protein